MRPGPASSEPTLVAGAEAASEAGSKLFACFWSSVGSLKISPMQSTGSGVPDGRSVTSPPPRPDRGGAGEGGLGQRPAVGVKGARGAVARASP